MKAVVKAGTLTITDSSGNDILTVDQSGLMDPTSFRLTPGLSTTVNGSASAQTFSGVTKDIRIVHAAGVDDDTIADLDTPRDLIVQTGNLSTYELGLEAALIGRDLKVDTKANQFGLDVSSGGGAIVKRDVKLSMAGTGGNVAILDPLFILRNLTWKCSAGTDLISFGDITKVAGTTSVDLAGGSDNMIHGAMTHFGGRLTVKGKTGTKQVTLSGTYHDDVMCDFGACDPVTATVDAVQISGSLTLKLGSGAQHAASIQSTAIGKGVDVQSKGDLDSISVFAAEVGGDARFKLGPGTNFVGISAGSQVGGDVLYFGSAASDDMGFSQSTVFGDVVCQLGAAPAGLDDGYSSLTSTYYGDVRISGTSGMHSGGIEDCGILGEARINYGADANSFTFDGGVYGSISILGGSGPDAYIITGGSLISHHGITVQLANGNNTLSIANSTTLAHLIVNAGSGDDTVSIAGTTSVVGDTLVDLGGGMNVGP